MNKQEFAESIKAKYPQYANEDNEELADKILAKYPVYRSKVDTDEKSTLRKVGDFFTSNTQKFGKTIGTAISTIDPETRKNREIALSSTNKMIDDIVQRAKNETDKEKANKLLESAKNLASTDNIDIFNNEEYKKTAKQVYGEAFGTLGETLQFSSFGGKGLKTGKLGSELPTVLKPLTVGKEIVKGAKIGAGYGAGFGAGFGVSNAMQENKSVGDIAKAGLTEGAIGVGGGAVLGGGASALIRGIGSLASKVSSRASKLTAVSKNKIGSMAYNKLNEVSRDLMKMSPTQAKNEARWNKNTPKFLVDEGVISLVESDGNKINTKEAVSALKNKYYAEANAFSNLLEDSGEYVSLNSLKDRALAELGDMKSRGSDYEKAVKQITDEVESYKRNYSKVGLKQGNDVLLNVSDFNKVKSGLWSRTTNFNPTQADKLSSDVNYRMGQVAKSLIEETVDDVGIKNMNSRLGDFQSSIKVLQNAEGKVLPGGFFAKQFARLAGTVAGSSGGVPGSIMGNLTGGVLADLAMDPKIKTSVFNKLYNNLNKTEKGASLVDEASAILLKRGETRANRLLLEESKQINVGPKTDTTKSYTQEEANELLEALGVIQKKADIQVEPEFIKTPEYTEKEQRFIDTLNFKQKEKATILNKLETEKQKLVSDIEKIRNSRSEVPFIEDNVLMENFQQFKNKFSKTVLDNSEDVAQFKKKTRQGNDVIDNILYHQDLSQDEVFSLFKGEALNTKEVGIVKKTAELKELNKDIIKNRKEMYGVVAGMEMDEDGNISFNPENAIAGMVALGITTNKGLIKELETSYQRISKDLNKQPTAKLKKGYQQALDSINKTIAEIRSNKKGFAKLPGKSADDILIQEAKKFDNGEDFYERMGQKNMSLLKEKGIKGQAQVTEFWENVTNKKSVESYAITHRPTKSGSAFDISNKEAIPADFYNNPEWYFNMDKQGKESFEALKSIKGKPNKEITIYRATPSNRLNEGDWVTFSKDYAEEQAIRMNTKVESFKVKAKDLEFAGDDINEFGYWGESI